MPARVNKPAVLIVVGVVVAVVISITAVWIYNLYTSGSAERLVSRKSEAAEARSESQRAQDAYDAAVRKEAAETVLEELKRDADARRGKEAFLLERLLLEYPKDEDSRMRLAQLKEEQGQLREAYDQYKTVWRNNPLNVRALLRMSYFEGLMGQWDESRRSARSAAELEPANAEAHRRVAEACLGISPDDYAEALTHALDAVKYDTTNVEGYLVLARVYQVQQLPDKAREVLDRAVEVAPESQDLWSFIAQHYLRLGQKEEAEKALKSAREHAKDPVTAEIQLGGFYTMNRQWTEAQSHFQAACDNATTAIDRQRAFTASGDFWMARDNATRALEQYHEALVVSPKARDVLNKTARVYLSQKQIDEARRAIDLVKAMGIRDRYGVEAMYLDGVRLYQEDRVDDAVREYEQALDMAQTAGVRMPAQNYVEILMALAQAKLRQGDVDGAKKALETAHQQVPGNLPVTLSLSRLMLATRDYEQTIQALEGKPLPFEGYQTLGRAYMGRASTVSGPAADSDLRGARLSLLKARVLRPRDVEVHLDLARLAVRRRDFTEAVEATDNAIRVRPDYVDAYLTKAAVLELAQRPKDAEDAYKQGIAALSDVSRQTLAYARFLARNKRFDEGDRLLSEAAARQPEGSALRKEYEYLIPRFYLAGNRSDKALEWYRAKAQTDPKDADSRHALALILLARGQFDDAAKTVEEMKAAEPPGTGRVAKLEGQLLVVRREYPEALAKLLDAEKATPKDPDVLYYIGYCYLRMGDAKKAQDYLDRVNRMVPGNPRVQRSLAEANYSVGDFADARKLAEGLKAGGQTGIDLEVILADTATRGGDPEGGEESWREFVKAHPDRSEGELGLADALLRQGKAAEALPHLESAYKLDNRSFRTTWPLANLYLQQKAYDKAVEVTKTALDSGEEKNKLALLGLLARLYEISGKTDDALPVYEQIRTLDPKNPLPWLAEAAKALTRKDLAGAEKAFREAYRLKPDDAGIRTRLVEVLVTARKFPEAHAVVDAARRDDAARPDKPEEVALTVLKGRVYLMEGNVKEGISLYQLALTQSRSRGMERQNYALHYELGQVYLQLKRLAEARTSFAAARDLQPDFIEARLALATVAAAEGRFGEARAECLNVIEKKTNLVALLILGDLSLNDGNLVQARRYYDRATTDFPQSSQPLRKRAEVSLREKNLDAVVADLRKVVELEAHDPGAVGLLTDVFTANKRYDDAMTFLAGETDRCPEPAAVQMFMGNVEASRGDFAKARTHYEASLNRRGDNVAVYLAKARTWLAEKNATRAIDEARQALKAKPGWETAYLFLEQVYRSENRSDDLRDLYLEWMRVLPDSDVAVNNYAWYLADVRNEADAALRVIADYRLRMGQQARTFPYEAELDDTEGRAWFKKGDYRRAAELFDKSLATRRNDARTWGHLRQAYEKLMERAKEQGDDTAAGLYERQMIRARDLELQNSPVTAESQTQIGDVRLGEGKVKEAIEAYQAALRLKKDPDVQRKLAEMLIRDGRPEDALPLVDDLTAADAKDPRNRVLRGFYLMQTGHSDEAVALLETLVHERPELFNAHYLLALAYVNRNEVEKAKTSLDQVSKLAPDFAGARLLKARILASQQKLDEAANECKAVLKTDPMNFEAAFTLGDLYLVRNRIPEAEPVFKDLVRQWPDSVLARQRLAECYRLSNRLGEAAIEYQDARRRNTSSLLLLRGLGAVLQAQGKNDQLLSLYTAFLEEVPGSTDAWIDLAQIHARAGRYPDAERSLKSAVRSQRANINVHVALIDYYIARKMYPEAREAARQLVESIPADPLALSVSHTATARTFEQENNVDEAIKEYRAALAVAATSQTPSPAAATQNVIVVNNLAWLLVTRKNDPDAAIALAEPRLKDAPGFAELYDTVGFAYRLKANTQNAGTVPTSAQSLQKAEDYFAHAVMVQNQQGGINPSILFHLGETLFLNGKTDDARKCLSALVDKNFPERDKAREILSRIPAPVTPEKAPETVPK